MLRWRGRILRWLFAVLVASVLGSVLQTQFNLAALADLGQSISWSQRGYVTLLDLGRFAPQYAGIVAVGFLIALPVAARLLQRWPRQRWLLPLAGAVAVCAALVIMRWQLGLTPIAAARGPWGMGALILSGAVGARCQAIQLLRSARSAV